MAHFAATNCRKVKRIYCHKLCSRRSPGKEPTTRNTLSKGARTLCIKNRNNGAKDRERAHTQTKWRRHKAQQWLRQQQKYFDNDFSLDFKNDMAFRAFVLAAVVVVLVVVLLVVSLIQSTCLSQHLYLRNRPHDTDTDDRHTHTHTSTHKEEEAKKSRFANVIYMCSLIRISVAPALCVCV